VKPAGAISAKFAKTKKGECMGNVLALKRESCGSISELVDFYSQKLGKEFLALEWTANDTYPKWMIEHFHLVRRTMRYINMAAGLSSLAEDETYKYWMHHLKEEVNHHKVLEKDAERFGIYLDKTEPAPMTKALVQVIYYGMIETKGIALFGYGPLLEGVACLAAGKTADRIEAKYGKGSAKFLRLHAEVDDGDDGHYAAMKNFIESLNEAQQSQVRDALEVSYSLYQEILRGVSGKK
jgi:pyrroloquinoline quinone (PQQ) biosynthesis protein C